MELLQYLVQKAANEEGGEQIFEKMLEAYCGEMKFKSPKIAAREFIRAQKDIEKKAAKVGIKPKEGFEI